MLVVCLVAGFFLVRFVSNKAQELAVQYTSEEQVEILPPALTAQETNSVVVRFDAFRDALASGQQPPVLELTDEEINTLIFHHPDFQDLAGKARVAIENGQVASEVSLDIDALGVPIPLIGDAVKDRFFNGEIALTIGMVGGRPVVNLEDVSVNGVTPPETVMAELRKENLLQDYDQDPEMKAFFDKIEAIEVEGNQLRIVPKGASGLPE